MKKLGLTVCIVVVVSIVCIYLFIPRTLVISRVVLSTCKANAASPILSEDSNWRKWWPLGGQAGKGAEGAGVAPAETGGAGAAGAVFVYNDFSYRLTRQYYHSVDVNIGTPQGELDSRISLIPLGNQDSSFLKWDCQSPAGMNPVKRVQRYLEARKIAANMDSILVRLGGFLEKKENLYGVAIRQGSTPDTYLVAIKSVYPTYPSTGTIYALVDQVQEYLSRGGARATGHPMVNVTRPEDNKALFQVRVAIPTDRLLQGKGSIYSTRLVPGKFLIGDVNGGEYAIEKALNGFQNYIRDYQRTVMAIPFQSLITDRRQQPDTSLWKTRIYYPIF